MKSWAEWKRAHYTRGAEGRIAPGERNRLMGTSDIEIAREVRLQPIETIAARLGLEAADIDPYGWHKAKIRWEAIERLRAAPPGALVLVTAMTPTPAGEGKSTISIGLADGLRRLGTRAIVALRQPSLGPVFGAKGGATGGGRAQIAPMEEINLHFTGDIHAVAAAHNLLAAIVDNHLHQDNPLGLDPRRIAWKRVVDINDRALRNVVIGLGGPAHGVPRESGFEIAVASEIMAVLCLATDVHDLRMRLARMVVGETPDGRLVTAGDLKAAGALTVLLREAIKPNLVQTLEATPALVHGGPFGNIAHGCSTLIATRLALGLAEVVVTEAGFATELGAEKFVHIKCRTGGLVPTAAVLVVTVRALRAHGRENLAQHVENLKRFGIPAVVALNHFAADTEAEVVAVLATCRDLGVEARVARPWAEGGAGAAELAGAVLDLVKGGDASTFRHLYPLDLGLREKITTIATTLYGADGVDFLPAALARLRKYEALGHGGLPVCIAKTQNSLSDDGKKAGRPRGFRVTIRDAMLAAGAGFVVAYAGDVLTLPGLPKTPSAELIDIDTAGEVTGLF